MALGDSLAAGCHDGGPGELGSYRMRLQTILMDGDITYDMLGSLTANCGSAPGGYDRDHEGNGGFDINQLVAITAARMTTYDPDVVAVIVGSNNYTDDDSTDFQTMYSDLFDAIGPGRTVFAFTPPKIAYDRVPFTEYWTDEWVDARNVTLGIIGAALKAEAALRSNVTALDAYAGLDPAIHIVADGTHPTSDGHGIMTNLLWAAMNAVYCIHQEGSQ